MIVLTRSSASIAACLLATQTRAVADINVAAGVVRLQFITDAPGQSMIYLRKEQEARQYLAADPVPADLTGYPLLTSEVAVTGFTPEVAALTVVGMADSWQIIGAQIEQARLTATKAIWEATTEDEVSLCLAAGLADLNTI